MMVTVTLTVEQARAMAYAAEFVREVFVHEWTNMGIPDDALQVAHGRLLSALERAGA